VCIKSVYEALLNLTKLTYDVRFTYYNLIIYLVDVRTNNWRVTLMVKRNYKARVGKP